MIGVKQLSDDKKTAEIRIRVTVLLKREDGKICFVRHKKNDKVYWLLPGGGQDVFESATEAAQRELQEELNVSAADFRLEFVRESFCTEQQRHIQFLVFSAVGPNFDQICTGIDERVEGYDFFAAEDLINRPIYPAMKQDIMDYLNDCPVRPFRTLDWIP